MNQQNSDNGEATLASRSRGFAMRPTLPDRRVSASTIEDAYVSFIFYCNPALPIPSDTESLRDAFRTPPKSGGKSFDTFAIYELVQKFYQRDIKTWTELTTTLGVEPPDLSKDESAQKVAQYGVRLKKWMNSMHVKAFFEYLMGIPNDYWTKVPVDPNPVAMAVRDGVAIEDDMALRALLPCIRPKRGRKRPEGDGTIASPAQRPRLSPKLMVVDDYRQGSSESWSAHPDARAAMSLDPSRTQQPTTWLPNESLQTPTTRASFWDDALEPRSASNPGKGKLSVQRRGAKNVSSAWKTTSQDPGTRPRGRPPINRTSMDDSAHYHPQAWTSTHETTKNSQLQRPPPQPPSIPLSMQIPTNHQHPCQATDGHHLNSQTKLLYDGASARSSISLQVPERWSGSVRWTTPPPAPTSYQEEVQASHTNVAKSAQGSEQSDGGESKYQDGWRRFAKEATDAYEQNAEPNVRATDAGLAADGELEDYYFDKMENRTNVDVLVAYFTRSMSEADWRDHNGNITPPVNLEQSTAMVHAMLQTMYKTATSAQAFLINLAALAGSITLVRTRPKCTRLSEQDGQFIYKCEWEYQFGQVKGGFTFEQTVPATMWAKAEKKSQRRRPSPPPPSATDDVDGAGANGTPAEKDDAEQSFSKAYWQKKYQELTMEMMNRDKDLANLKDKVMAALGREF